MDTGEKILELTLDTALEKFKAQLHFCKKEKERFKKRNSLDSTMFYTSKLQELKWQMLQLKQHHDTTGEVLKLKRECVSVPVVADNEDLQDDQLEFNVSDIFFNPVTESKKQYFLRYVICLPLQRTVLQEQKSEPFRTTDLEKAENKLLFHYPRTDLKVCDSLKRGYLTVELYAERKLKAPSLIGAKRVTLQPFINEATIKGMLSFGPNGEWDISYSLNIRRAQTQEERDNFKMVQKNWVGLFEDCNRVTRRVSIATMHSSPGHRKHSRNNRNHRSKKVVEELDEKSEQSSSLPASVTNSSDSLKNKTSDRISDIPSPDNQNKNTTNKIKKTLRKRLSGLF